MTKEERFNLIYDKYNKYVNYLLRHIYSLHDREDIAQDLGLLVGCKLENIEEGKESAFIRSCVKNLVGNYITKSEKRIEMVNKLQLIKEAESGNVYSYLEIMDILQSSLNEGQFQYIMYFIQGFTQMEIAKQLGLTQSRVSKYMTKAIEAARLALAE